MEFEAFKNTIMDLVSKEVEDRGLEGISMKLTTVESPDGMTDRLMVSVDDSKMSMAFRLKEIYQSVEDGEDIDHAVYKIDQLQFTLFGNHPVAKILFIRYIIQALCQNKTRSLIVPDIGLCGFQIDDANVCLSLSHCFIYGLYRRNTPELPVVSDVLCHQRLLQGTALDDQGFI